MSPVAEACAGMLSRSRARPLSPPPFGLLIRSELSLSASHPPRPPGVDIVPRLPHSLTLLLRASLIFCYLRLPLFFQPQVPDQKRINIINSHFYAFSERMSQKQFSAWNRQLGPSHFISPPAPMCGPQPPKQTRRRKGDSFSILGRNGGRRPTQ